MQYWGQLQNLVEVDDFHNYVMKLQYLVAESGKQYSLVLANLTLVCWTVWSVPINDIVKFIAPLNLTLMCWDVDVIMCENRKRELQSFFMFWFGHIDF